MQKSSTASPRLAAMQSLSSARLRGRCFRSLSKAGKNYYVASPRLTVMQSIEKD